MSKKEFDRWIRVLCDYKEDFECVIGKNSQFIKTASGQKMDFVDRRLNPKVFSIVRELKQEVEGWLMFNERFHDVRERAHIKYFNYTSNLPKKLENFFYIDISAAYITSLYLAGIITEYLFNLINDLPKKDRLICLGMLAYEPYVIQYIDGKKASEPTKKRNYYSPVFYQACLFIEEIMTEIINILKEKRLYYYRAGNVEKDNYLFYWVDGIFFQDPEYIPVISDFLTKKGYQFKSGNCFNWELKEVLNCYKLNFIQEEKGELKNKEYNLPHFFQNIRDNTENIKLLKEGKYDELFIKFREQNYGEIK